MWSVTTTILALTAGAAVQARPPIQMAEAEAEKPKPQRKYVWQSAWSQGQGMPS